VFRNSVATLQKKNTQEVSVTKVNRLGLMLFRLITVYSNPLTMLRCQIVDFNVQARVAHNFHCAVAVRVGYSLNLHPVIK
jgi:hypothetical protein